jgi:hypothetical protein
VGLFLARVPDLTRRQGQLLLMILFVRRLLEIAGGVVRRGVRAGLCGLPDELGCQRPWRLRGQGRPEAVAGAIASATLEAGGAAAEAGRRSTAAALGLSSLLARLVHDC